jgi:hypothetical protein
LKHAFDVVNVAAIELKTRDANFTKVRAEREWLRHPANRWVRLLKKPLASPFDSKGTTVRRV